MPRGAVRREEEHLYADPPRTAAGKDLAAALLRFWRAGRVQETRALQTSGLSRLDLQALRLVAQAARNEKNLSPKSLGSMLETSSANITNIVTRLEQKGFVERVNHPTDRRAHHLKPTDAAIALIASVIGEQHVALVELVDSTGEEEARIAATVLNKFSEAIDAAAEPAPR